MAYFVFKLIAPRPTFAQDMTPEEGAVMKQHVVFWERLLGSGQAITFGPVLDPKGAWGLGILRVADEAEGLRLSALDPAVSEGIATFELLPANLHFLSES